jgi:hydroxyethylthiazole kinase-like uncharacterized protein yjeF
VKILTAAQMRAVDQRTIELGTPGIVLMENAGRRVAELLTENFSPLERQRIVVLCGKGNNGGDGFVVARLLHTRFHPQSLDVVSAGDPADLRGDAAESYRKLSDAGISVAREIASEMREATLLVDALLGTGFIGPARGRAAELIHEINTGFPHAKVVAVDVPSGIESDSGASDGEAARADYTITFTAPKPCHALPPACDRMGEIHVAQIGSPPDLYENDHSIWLALSEPALFRRLFKPRPPDSNKGMYGHVLVIAGARGTTGAAAMAGVAALRAGAGLVTVASAASALTAIASYAPELMTHALPETDNGSITLKEFSAEVFERKDVIAIGPGLGRHPETVEFIRRIVNESPLPMVVDADALNALAGERFHAQAVRVFTPHPGEMARLTALSVADVQRDRIGVARAFARERNVHLALKGNRTVIAFPDGRVFVNPTGSPALATAGTGDVLTGLTAGLMGQSTDDLDSAVLAAVYLHGRAGEIGARELGEKALIATDLFRFLPEAMREVADLSHRL